MQHESEGVRLSASDLANHLACRHLTCLDLNQALGRIPGPPRYDWQLAELETMRERGFQHEHAYIEELCRADLSMEQAPRSRTATAQAMRRGADIIVQAALGSGRWSGRADILRRVEGRSQLGDWVYEVVDTKLSRETKAGTILQLCLYSDMVKEIQGTLPKRMHVVSPGTDPMQPFVAEIFRVQDYLAYYRLMRRKIEQAVETDIEADTPGTYPEPVPHCDICRWQIPCRGRRREDDHLSLVASLGRLHQRQIRDWSIDTLTAFAELPIPIPYRPRRGSIKVYETGREQARVQLEGRRQEAPRYELLQREGGRGLALLPAPSPGDIFFDLEGARFVGAQGFEYLFGWAEQDIAGHVQYHATWAFEPGAEHESFAVQERRVFEEFVDTVMVRWREHERLHIYHFAPYEPSALKRLMGRFATRGAELDRMLRAKLFVDLHTITRQALRASVEQYSLKDLEPFHDFTRDVELRQANDNRHRMERLLETGRRAEVTEEMRRIVEGYNRDDCVSTMRLRDWLEHIRGDLVKRGEEIPRPELTRGDPSEEVAEREAQVDALRTRLLEHIPDDDGERTPEQQAQWLLAYLLDWHRREAKSLWWEFFCLAEMPPDELQQEDKGLVGLKFAKRIGGTKVAPVDRYKYDEQDTTILKGNKLYLPGEERKLGIVEHIDPIARMIEVKKRKDTADLHPEALYARSKPIPSITLEKSLSRLGKWVADNGIDTTGDHRAARDLLLAHSPRHCSGKEQTDPLRKANESAAEAAERLVLELDGGVLPIQGPPGTGKTHTGGRMICALIRAGKKVGITANSHSVIRNLIDAAVKAADREDLDLRCIQKISEMPEGEEWPVKQTKRNQDVLTALSRGEAQVGAGTAWLWSRAEFQSSVDVLFIDEAGQMSLANTLAVAQSADSLVLLGDPQQLDQPLQGSHPDGTDASALGHLLGEHQTMPEEKGLFLDETWRLHPSISRFTSELFYDNSLRARPGLDRQLLSGAGDLDGHGLRFLPVEHDGNQSASTEEADQVAILVHRLLGGGVSWTDHEGQPQVLSQNDILIVAPYNAHLAELRRRLPDARIGTVDKFQGQEAPVVIYSMATSSAEDAPRGMEFLFNLNRLNVATSRARCVTILVCSPMLLEPDCQTPRQMRLANALCRYREMARIVARDYR